MKKKDWRHQARSYALMFLYQRDIYPDPPLEETWVDFWSQQPEELDDRVTEFAETIAQGVLTHQEEIDEKIKSQLQNWSFERVAVIDRNILRIALFEMLHRNDIPPVVSINEAIELAKEFSTDESGSFVNGILDRVREELPRPARIPAGGGET